MRHGRSQCLRVREAQRLRLVEGQRFRVWHGCRTNCHAEVRRRRDPVVLRGRRAVFGAVRMRILPAWLREFVDVKADDRQLAEDLTSAGIAVESVAEEHGSTIFEMDLTTNRVDAMNHYGVAREAAAIYGVELKAFEPKLPGLGRGLSTAVSRP